MSSIRNSTTSLRYNCPCIFIFIPVSMVKIKTHLESL